MLGRQNCSFLSKAIRAAWRHEASTSRCIATSASVLAQTDSNVFQEPILDKDKLGLPLDETDKRIYLPVRAMRDHEIPVFFRDHVRQKFINVIAEDSNTALGERILFKAFERIKLTQIKRWRKAKTDEERAEIEVNPHVIFDQAMTNMRPMLKIISYVKGGITYSVPSPVSDKQALFMSIKMIRETCRNDKSRNVRVWDMLARELIAASKNEGKCIAKKQELHKTCEANRAYAHYRWT